MLYRIWDREQTFTRAYLYSTTLRTQTEILGPGGLPLAPKSTVGMNELGEVIGTSVGEQRFLWRAGTATPLLVAPPDGYPIGINEAGHILFDRTTAVDRYVQVFDGVAYPVEERPDYHISRPVMAPSGRLVGAICKYCAIPHRAAIWERGRIVWLDQGLTAAVAVNARGEMAGNRYLNTDLMRAIKWVPLE